jgi:protein-S-isoprenylcysteine O-methyltransferase Ste14
MKIKGFEKFREKLPALSGKKIIIIPIFFILMFLINLFIELYFDLLPTIVPATGFLGLLRPFFPIIGVILMVSIGLFLVYQMWYHRDRLKAKYGQLSYQKIIFVGFMGITIMLGQLIHNIVSNFIWQSSFWTEYPFSLFTTPIHLFFPGLEFSLGIVSILFGIFFVCVGLMMIYRAFVVFGFDYMTVVYLYFPEESELQDHEIYSVLRHPTYAGGIILFLGTTFLYLNLYSILFFIIFYLGFYIHIQFVEEKELIQRFGDSYTEYKKEVPAFIVKPKNLGKFFRFILGKE